MWDFGWVLYIMDKWVVFLYWRCECILQIGWKLIIIGGGVVLSYLFLSKSRYPNYKLLVLFWCLEEYGEDPPRYCYFAKGCVCFIEMRDKCWREDLGD